MKLFYTVITAAIIFAGSLQTLIAQTVTSVQLAVSTKPTDPVTEGKLAVGGTRTLVPIVTPAEAASLPVTWSVADPSIVALDASVKGKFRGMAPGTTIVSAEVGGVKANYTVAVTQKDAKIGDFFFDNNTWESSGGIVAGKNCIGIVFYVNPNDGQSGKIVSLDEATRLRWSLAASAQPGATSTLDGIENLNAIETQPNWQDSFAAEQWCASKTEGNLQWYLPAIDELRQLFAATCGLVWRAPGEETNDAQINPNWTDMLQTMLAGDNINPFPEARTAFNKKFTNIGATPLNSDNTMRYWSSTQYESDFALLLSFEGGYSMANPRQYDHVGNTRAIAAFKAKEGVISGVGSIAATSGLKISVAGGSAIVTAGVNIASVQVYAITGEATCSNADIKGTTATIDIESMPAGIYIVTATGVDGTRSSAKLLKR